MFVDENIVRYLHLLFAIFWPTRFGFLDVLSLFNIVRYFNSGSLKFSLISFSVKQCLPSYGGHVLALDAAEWATLQQQAENFSYQLYWPSFPSFENVACGREHCLSTLQTCHILLTNKFCLFRCILVFYPIKCATPNRVLLNSVWCHFCDISILFSSSWGPMIATY